MKPGALATNPVTLTIRVIADRPPAADAAAARALSAHARASAAASSAVTASPTFPVASSLPSASGNCPAVYTCEPVRSAGTYEPAGAATGGRVRPSAARRSSRRAHQRRPGCWTLIRFGRFM